MSVVASPTLLERARQLSELADALDTVREHDRGALMLVRGEAGAGKTALVRSFVDGLGPGARGLWAACDPLFTPRPLGPLLDLGEATGGALADQVRRGAQPHDVAAALIAELQARGPGLLVIEDLHWADEATLDVLRLLARRIETVPVLAVASYRDDQLGRTHPLQIVLGELPHSATTRRLEVSALSRDAVCELASGSSLDADELYDATNGNPFFVTEALAAQTERVPATVRDAVLARAARLSGQARTLLDAVAVVPQRTELWLMQALAPDALSALDECLSSGMLTAGVDGVGFRHELARLAVEASLSPPRAIALHRRAVQALREPPHGRPDLARLAHHAEGADDAELVLRFAPAAASHAAAVGSPREGQDQYARALRFATDAPLPLRAELLEAFADMGYLTDMRAEALDALQAALTIHRARGDRLGEARTLRLHSRLLTCMGRTTESKADAQQAIDVLTPLTAGPELARAYAALSHVSMLSDHTEDALTAGRRAIELAEQVGDDEALVNALNNVGSTRLGGGEPGGLADLQRSLEIARAREFGPDAGRAYINIAAALRRLHRHAEAQPFIEAGIEYCRQRGLEAWLNCMLASRAAADLAQGRWDTAAETALALVSAPPNFNVSPRHEALLVLASVRARRGDPGYRPLLDEAREIATAAGDLQFLAPVALVAAEVAWLEGRPGDIATETEAALALAHDLHDATVAAELLAWRARGDGPTAAARELVEVWTARGCPYDAALAAFDSDDPGALREALQTLGTLQARAAHAVVARRLRTLGERGLPRGPRPATRANPAGLTARELEVVALLAQGLRNAEIAQRLVVSPKTVDHHVSAILRKLEVPSRAAAAARVSELGLAAPN